MWSLLAVPLLVLVGCAPTGDVSASWFDDPDGDGVGRDEDCAESDPTLPRDYYTDADGDGFGGDETVSACERPAGSADVSGDCDDTDAQVNPGAAEACNGKDDNCDGTTDGADSVDPLIGYLDEDGDGWGDGVVQACVLPEASVASNGDCDDSDAAVFPGATELCNGVDDDCDGETDEDDAADALLGFADADGDGYGSDDSPVAGCQLPEDASFVGGDCKDDDASISPGADEVCDGADNDCDAQTDEPDALDAPTWYLDADGDGQGAPDTAEWACSRPDGWVSSSTDCDDLRADTYSGAPEWCDGVDHDCDGAALESDSVDASVWYTDSDADRLGDPATGRAACVAAAGEVGLAGDCDDSRSDVHPGAPEVCDGLDDDCDGVVDALDSDLSGGTVVYADADGDGYGDSTTATTACEVSASESAVDGDCDDTDAATSPSGEETCGDGVDQDCDGADLVCIVDVDGDGIDDDTADNLLASGTTLCVRDTLIGWSGTAYFVGYGMPGGWTPGLNPATDDGTWSCAEMTGALHRVSLTDPTATDWTDVNSYCAAYADPLCDYYTSGAIWNICFDVASGSIQPADCSAT